MRLRLLRRTQWQLSMAFFQGGAPEAQSQASGSGHSRVEWPDSRVWVEIVFARLNLELVWRADPNKLAQLIGARAPAPALVS